MSVERLDTDTESSSEEDLDSGIVDESPEARRDVDCMDLSEFFSYW